MGREVSSTDQNTGEVTTTTYDFMGRVVKTERSLTDQEGNKTSQTETKSYNANGAVTSETSSAGVTTEYRYDSRNRVTTTKEDADNTTKTTETSYGYETAVIHTLTGTKTYKDLQVQTTKVNGTVTDKTWTDHAGNAVRTLSNGIYTDHVFTEDGKEIAAVTLGSSTDGEGKISLALYNKEGKTTHTISQPVIDGDSITTGKDTIINETAYDINGNESAVTDGNGNVTTYTYDDQNRVTGVSRKNGNETISNSISYDMGADGKTTTSVKDANGHVNKEVTNEAGLTESTTDLGDGEEQITTAYSYDTNGNKIRETYADGGYKTFDYDRKNRLIKTESYEAGEAGESIGEKTLKTVYSYDINDRLLESIDYQIDGAEETTVRYTEYQYDRRGQTTGYAELSQENAPTADEIKEHQIRYHYDSDGKLTKVTYPTTKNGVQALAYEYDQNGWLTKIKGEVQSADTSTEKTVRSYTYDSYGKVKEIKDYRDLLNSSDQAVKKAYTYDSLDRVKEMTYTDLETGKVMESYRYSYDKNSNITEKTEVNNYPKEDTDKVNETKAYTYDALGRLTKTVTTDHKNDDKTKTVTYTYDKAGNRTTEDDGTTQTAYTYNGLDQLQTATKEKGTAVDEVRQYSYDANGNQTDVKNTKTGQTESYTYDAENRLSKVSVTDKDGKTAVIQQNHYNGDGQRIQKVEGSKTTNYYYQDGVVSYTTDGENSQTSQNLIGTDGNILATQRYGSDHTDYLLYHKDIQGSTTSLVKEDGSADATYRYTDFGETTINGDNKAENEVCYTGGIYDHSTGLYYLNARYYNPEDGRFVTEDTYRGETAKPETGHLYAYCANNPVNYVDPSGHKAKTVIYYNKKGKDFKKQAMHSPYYKNSQVTFKSVIKKAQFKKEWDKIPKGTSELYLYLHGGVSCLYFDGSDMNLKELLALKKKKIKKKIVLLSCKGGIGDKNSVAKIMAKKCQCVVYASSYPYGLSYRYDKKKKVYYPRYGGKRNYYNHENPLKKYKP
ncbi:RHS repeat-associated core domain-containing protein [Anaerostipes hadrus]|uniref:RHS repeat-associated core domain-containing protein n=1 Tax=Anaerostipes hadrus TaxID=649756 RepID=UPI00156DB056|nr:RHS repeat-associated core domain-containing protein [Anaerostipes hadrus]